MSTSWEPLPSIYRSKQEFLASLPPWRRLLQKLNWHPTIDTSVRQYELEQRMLQDEKEDALIESDIARLKKENARLAQVNSRLERFEREHLSGSTPPPSTEGFSS
jgi:hypothetical protein